MEPLKHNNSYQHTNFGIQKIRGGRELYVSSKAQKRLIVYNIHLLKCKMKARLPNKLETAIPPLCEGLVHGRRGLGGCLILINLKQQNYYQVLMCAFILLIALASNRSFAQNSGMERIDSIKNQLSYIKNDTQKVMLFNSLSAAYKGTNPIEGIKYGNLGLALASKMELQSGIADAYNSIGLNHFAKSDYVSALEYYNKALAIVERDGKIKRASEIIGNISLVYLAKGDYAKALDANFKSLKISESLNNKDGRATNLGNIGAIYMSLGNYEQSLKYHQMSVDLFEEVGNHNGAASNLGNIGNVYQAMGNYAKAIEFSFKSLDYFKKLGDNAAIATCLLNIGSIYHSMGDYPRALDFDFKSLALFMVQGDNGGVAIDYGNIGEDYLALAQSKLPLKKNDSLVPPTKPGVINKAIEYLKKGIELSKTNTQLDNIREFSKSLSEAYKLSGNDKMAFEAYQEYSKIKDSLLTNSGKVQIANLEHTRELELKDKDLEISKLDAARIRNRSAFYTVSILLLLVVIGIIARVSYNRKRANKKLALEAERHRLRIEKQKKLLGEIANIQSHDVRGPVSTIMGLTQIYNYNDPSDPTNEMVINGLAEVTKKLDIIVKDLVINENTVGWISRDEKLI